MTDTVFESNNAASGKSFSPHNGGCWGSQAGFDFTGVCRCAGAASSSDPKDCGLFKLRLVSVFEQADDKLCKLANKNFIKYNLYNDQYLVHIEDREGQIHKEIDYIVKAKLLLQFQKFHKDEKEGYAQCSRGRLKLDKYN